MSAPLEVPDSAGGERLDRWLAESGAVGSRSAAARLIAAGAVRVDGAPAKASTRLEGGESVEVDMPPEEPLPAPPEHDVVHADEWILVIDKPAGLVVHPAPGHQGTTLAEIVSGEAKGGEPGRSGIVHRLDKGTSGLLVVARSEEAHRKLSAALKARRVHREYAALVCGRPDARTGTIEAPLGRDPRDPSRMTVGGTRERPAVTHFEVEEAFAEHTLLKVRLETGRTHQIRVHLASIGLPVAGDARYGRPDVLGLQRQFLHARRLEFDHPGTGEKVSFTSALPRDLAEALEDAGLRTIP